MRRVLRIGGSAVIVGIVVAGAGCTSLPPAEQESLRQAADQYRSGHYGPALARVDRIIDDYADAAEIAEAYYIRGLCRSRLGERQAAASDFQQTISRSNRPELTARAHASLAALYFEQGQWAPSADHYAQALDDLPEEPPADRIAFTAAVAMRRAGRWADARRQFARTVFRFRDRPIAEEARRQAFWDHDYFSIQLGAFSSVANAEQRAKEVRGRGLNAAVGSQDRDGGVRWVVAVGQYGTYDEAIRDLDRVRRVQADAYIIP